MEGRRSTRCWLAVETDPDWVSAFADGDYTTNVGLEDVTHGRAWIANEFDGAPLDPEHGGPAAPVLLEEREVVGGLALTPQDEPGSCEVYGYHNYGDPQGSSAPKATGCARGADRVAGWRGLTA